MNEKHKEKIKINKNIKFATNMVDRITNDFCSKEYTFSDFVRDAVYEKLEKESSMIDVLTESTSKMSENIHRISQDNDITMRLIEKFILLYFMNTPAIPDKEARKVALASASVRMERFRKSLAHDIKQDKKTYVLDLLGE